jgi:hypothetical protein
MSENLKNQDVLLVREKGSNELRVASADKDGKAKAVKPTDGENPDFLKIDKHGSILENFFKNFMRQVKDPTRFEFFRVPVDKLKEGIERLRDALKNPNSPLNKAVLDAHRVEPGEYIKQGQTANHAIDDSRVDWSQFERIGVSREALEKTGGLKKLLNWQKTDLMPIRLKHDDATITTDARLALRDKGDGTMGVSIHAIRKEPEIDRPYFGVRFSEEDKNTLLRTGNLGRIAEAEFTKGVKTPVYLSLDKLTNEIVAVRADRVRIPETIKGARLSEQQQRDLAAGKSVRVDGMSTDGVGYSAELQYNANKKGFDFFFKNDPRQSEVPKKFRGKELTEDQRSSLGEGKTVHVEGLKDKKGKQYNGYVTLEKSTWRLEFMFPKEYKAALDAGHIIPDDRHKTQVAVNSDGKTNEPTKHAQAAGEPMKQGQTQPTEKQAEKQAAEQEQEKPKRSRGFRM